MDKLILITNKFPYGNDTGEIYLKYEINSLCKTFAEVDIISCTGKESDGFYLKEIPDNLKIIQLKDNNNKIIYAIKSICFLFKKKGNEYFEELKKTNSISKKIFLIYFLTKANNRLKMINKMNLFLDTNKNDKVIIYSYRLFDFAYIALELKEKYFNEVTTKVISRAHGYDLYEESNKINYLPMRNYLINNLDKIFPCSFNGEDYLIKKYLKCSSKIKCMYLGSEDYGYKKAFHFDNKGIRVVSCSNINEIKRVDFIADVIEELAKKTKVEWIHIGGNKKSIEKISKKHKSLIMKQTIQFTGKMNHYDVIEYYKNNNVDLFINLSKSEGISQSIMEAISFGIPCIATNVGGTSEIVVDNISGFLVNLSDSSSIIANKIIKYANTNDKEKMKLRESTRLYWEKNYNTDINIKRFIREIKK